MEPITTVQRFIDALPSEGRAKLSDGFHSFEELYETRNALIVALCMTLWADPQYQTGKRSEIWRSLTHSDGTSIPGWFILGIGSKSGEQITFHLPMSKWEKTNDLPTYDKAPPFDGHTTKDVIERLKEL